MNDCFTILIRVFAVPCILQLLFGLVFKNKVLKFLPLIIFSIVYFCAILDFLGFVYLGPILSTGGFLSFDLLDFALTSGLGIYLSLGVGVLIVQATQDKP